jgi:hypothetical protein
VLTCNANVEEVSQKIKLLYIVYIIDKVLLVRLVLEELDKDKLVEYNLLDVLAPWILDLSAVKDNIVEATQFNYIE